MKAQPFAVSTHLAAPWSPDSWRSHVAEQQPRYPDADALSRALDELRALPPLRKLPQLPCR